MQMIAAENPDEALVRGLTLLESIGIKEPTRVGEALVLPCPMMTINYQPMRRVSFSPLRDANPFFHLMEALWMLAGRNDATWLDQFVGDFSKRYAEPDGLMHAAYGFRWRSHFELEGGGGWPDQLLKVVKLLKANPFDRRVVIAMWDPVADLGADFRDIPCNTHIYPRVREQHGYDDGVPVGSMKFLDLTVCCRSNDAIWGCHGSNVVHFSVLQEYLAAQIGVAVGTLYQLSNNYHAYTDPMKKFWPGIQGEANHDLYYRVPITKIVTRPEKFDGDLSFFFGDGWSTERDYYANTFFDDVAVPLRRAYALWKSGEHNDARKIVSRMRICDWSIAAGNWFERRAHRAQGLKSED